MNQSRLGNVAAAVISLCAVLVTATVVRREFFAPAKPTNDEPIISIENWRDYAGTGQRIGPANAPVTITEFSDYQCPFCAELDRTLQELIRAHPGKVAIVYRHFPLVKLHPYANSPALASECAAAEGKFEAFHRVLFAQQDSIGHRTWGRFALDAGISDSLSFLKCVDDATFANRVEQDLKAGKSLNVRGTPTYLINEKRVSGILPLEELERHVAAALKSSGSGT